MNELKVLKRTYKLQYANWIVKITDTSGHRFESSRVHVLAKNGETGQELKADLGTHSEISGKERSDFTSEQANLLAAIRAELGYCIPTIEELYSDWWDEKYREYHEPIFSDDEELRKVMESGKSVILHGCEFWLVTAISSIFPEEGRQNAILVHYLKDEYHDGDYVIFDGDGALSPVTEENVDDLLKEEEYCAVGDYQTLNSVRLRDS